MLEMYLFETTQNLEQLEQCILDNEKQSSYAPTTINEIFRIMHTIKGSSAMMLFNNIAILAHSMEDLFYFIREHNPGNVDYDILSSFILEGVDFTREELQKISNQSSADGNADALIERIKAFLSALKQDNQLHAETEKPSVIQPEHYYIPPDQGESNKDQNIFKAIIWFTEGCEMENIRAFTVIHHMKEIANEVYHLPEDILGCENSIQKIQQDGFLIYLKTEKSYDEINERLSQTIFLKYMELIQLDNDDELKQFCKMDTIVLETVPIQIPKLQAENSAVISQSMISVNIAKLDKLMDLVSELVIAESMVTQNPDLKDLELENFRKAAHQLHKITNELQDTVMSVRMVPLAGTFHKMQRIVRDMSKKLEKEIKLELLGEETEVDKNIIEHISDPLMHLVRNAVDHGIEKTQERMLTDKPEVGTVTLEAKNAGSDVVILVRDDGKGLNKEKILSKARAANLITKPESEMNEKEIFNLIFLPGFSTKESVTEFSGRGVGMDVVSKNIGEVGGTVSIDSKEGAGSTVCLKIPLTLAIIDGMNVRVGSSYYTIPIASIRESFRPQKLNLIRDPDGNEMIMVRGQCYPILRLHEIYHIKTKVTDFTEGIFVMVEHEEVMFCVFADELIGQQQVVIKSLPSYIKKSGIIKGLAGCTLLGEGSISLILDVGGLYSYIRNGILVTELK